MYTILYLDHAPVLGGAQVVLLNTVARLDRARFCPKVACPGQSKLARRLAELGVEAIPLEMGKLNRPRPVSLLHLMKARSALSRLLREHAVDILHTNTVRAHIVGGLASRPQGCPLFWTLHDFTLPRAVCRLLSPRVSMALAVSRAGWDYYRGSFRGEGRIEVLYNGVRLPELPLEGSLREELGLPAEAPVVGCIGRLVLGKGQDVFLKAAGVVAREMPEARFLLVGEPDPGEVHHRWPFSQELRKLSQEPELAGRVRFTGFRSDMEAVYATLDEAVHAAREVEPFGLAVAEAMASGVPIVATDLGGARELIEDGVSGILVPPEDAEALARAMLALLQGRERAQAMAQAARQRAERLFDLDRQVRKLEELYEQALEGRG